MMKKLWIDDFRPPRDNKGWLWAITITEAIEILTKRKIDSLSLDFDILCQDYKRPHYSEENFSSVAHFVSTMPPNCRPRKVIIHTASEKGSKLLSEILRSKVKHLFRDLTYAREFLGGSSLSSGFMENGKRTRKTKI